MLPPQLAGGSLAVRRHSIATTSSLSSSSSSLYRPASASQARSLFGWGKGRYDDWSSPMDPAYHRYAKYHTVKSRAKLLKSLKRRSKFEWDCNQRPFFSPRHIRFASHFNRGGPGSTWNQFARNQSGNQQAKAQEKPTRDDSDSSEGYELSQREKEWKERMEFMRKRIEQDPYEAVFGKRFEPFWSPLVPSWMREEVGLKGPDRYKPRSWDKNATPRVEPQDHQRNLQDIHQVKESLESQPSRDRQDTAAKREHKDDPGLSYGTDLWPESKADLLSTRRDAIDDPGLSSTSKAQTPSKSEPVPKASAGTTSSPRNYASYDSTSWDSWTNKTCRTEWDSASGKVKRFEYDPVTNRYVQIEDPRSSEGREIRPEVAESDEYLRDVAAWQATTKQQPPSNVKSSEGREIRPEVAESDEYMRDVAAWKATTKQQPSSNVKTSLPTRPGDMRSLINTPSGDVVNTVGRVSNADKQEGGRPTSPTRPAALANMPKDDIDLLTADNVRASMGKTRKPEVPSKATKTAERAAMDARFDKPISEHDAEVHDIIREREIAKSNNGQHTKQAMSQWDAAEEEVMLERDIQSLTQQKAKLLRGERSAYHFERIKKEVFKFDEQIAELKSRLHTKQAKSQRAAAEKQVMLERNIQSLTQQKAKLLRGERSAYHFERIKKEVIKLDGQIAELKSQLNPDTTTSTSSRKVVDLDGKTGQASNSAPATEPNKSADKLQTSLDRSNPAAEKLRPMTLQPSLDRLQSGKPIRDLDDSAAHESTEPLPTPISNAVPAGWSDAADRLQADRVRRTASNKPYPMSPRWTDDMKARKARWEATKPQPTKAELEYRSRMEKANALLKAEINDQKLKMAAHEDKLKEKAPRSPEEEFRIQCGIEEELAKFKSPTSLTEEEKRIQQLEAELAKTRMLAVDASTGKPATEAVRDEKKYVDKIRNLRAELDVAYKQSSVHAEEYMHRINGLETELAKFKETPTAVREHDMPEHDVPRTPNKSPRSANESFDADKAKYVDKIKSLRQELDRTFKQSAVQGEKHIERIRYLESELAKSGQHSTMSSAGSSSKSMKPVGTADTKAKEVQAEGDFDPKICDFAAADGGKWYKQPTCPPQPSKEEMATAEQKARDRALVDEVKGIYERRYGPIDVEHRQVRESEPKPREGAEDPGFMNDPAWRKALKDYEVRGNWYESKPNGLAKELEAKEKGRTHTQVSSTPVQDKKVVDDASPKLIPTGLANKQNEKATNPEVSPVSAIEWEHPPLYKVLAYDSGNDQFSTATTTTPAFSEATVETPISIPQALSQLYQPARFVPHFAELQREGFQVIHGTRDLLVFKKVKTSNDTFSAKEADAASSGQASLVDHGLIKPKENGMAEDAANYYGKLTAAGEKIGKDTSKGYDSTSLESGRILIPYENALAQEAAQAYDENAAAPSPPVNPIDGSSGLSGGTPLSEVSTGNFASPTGFVNHDPVFPAEGGPKDDFGGAVVEGADTKLKSARTQEWENGAGAGSEYRHSPTTRVRREEPVFSGSKKRWNERHERHHRRPRSQYHRNRGGLFGWVVKVGVSAAAVSYVIGVAAEYSRQDVRERERLRGIVEGRAR
ncbi:hypothetical protein KC360_g7637 [Hortaea werneckii]|nr:hypothetical protein KC325_g7616 [Hortaea werneckii]KAI6988010.1 hypothetical protein KC359_g7969 [Hortaea werneckii]KAI7141888.1 hypothetical protein KC344_g7628 [Hortaea werneckii]KAI7169167.1 hypothetical protein KC360_g7637 [Hortaea werneckii]